MNKKQVKFKKRVSLCYDVTQKLCEYPLLGGK